MKDEDKEVLMQIIDIMGRLTAIENILIRKEIFTTKEYFEEIESMSAKLAEKLNASIKQ